MQQQLPQLQLLLHALEHVHGELHALLQHPIPV